MKTKKIMVVDDNPDITSSVKQGLQYLCPDYEIVCADSGSGCLELLKNGEIPDLILLDIMMPGMSGWMLSDRLKENPTWKNIPIIVLTARTDEFAKKVADTLCNDYLEKPFDVEDLKKRIDKVLKESTS